MKVIYHIDTMEAWTMTLGNVRNMLDGLHQNQESYEIEVLANGPAVRGYLPGILPDSLNVVMAQAKACLLYTSQRVIEYPVQNDSGRSDSRAALKRDDHRGPAGDSGLRRIIPDLSGNLVSVL